MKRNLSARAAGVIITVVVAVVLVLGFRLLRDPAGSLDGQMPPQMPADVAAEFGRRMSQAKRPITPGAPMTSPLSRIELTNAPGMPTTNDAVSHGCG